MENGTYISRNWTSYLSKNGICQLKTAVDSFLGFNRLNFRPGFVDTSQLANQTVYDVAAQYLPPGDLPKVPAAQFPYFGFKAVLIDTLAQGKIELINSTDHITFEVRFDSEITFFLPFCSVNRVKIIEGNTVKNSSWILTPFNSKSDWSDWKLIPTNCDVVGVALSNIDVRAIQAPDLLPPSNIIGVMDEYLISNFKEIADRILAEIQTTLVSSPFKRSWNESKQI